MYYYVYILLNNTTIYKLRNRR